MLMEAAAHHSYLARGWGYETCTALPTWLCLSLGIIANGEYDVSCNPTIFGEPPPLPGLYDTVCFTA